MTGVKTTSILAKACGNRVLSQKLSSLCTLPAGADGELGFDRGGMQRVILRDQERLKCGTIHKQSHCRELDVHHVVMPFFITHLRQETGIRLYNI